MSDIACVLLGGCIIGAGLGISDVGPGRSLVLVIGLSAAWGVAWRLVR